jgi:uncharacterized protein YegJ (DUF2314 family)
VLLLKASARLDVEAVRTGWARVVKAAVEATPQAKGAWLQAEGDTLIGGRDGVRFTVRCGAARELDDQALRHLDDDDREKVRSHRSVLEVVCTNELGKDADRVMAYRVLGGIAAAAARGVVGVGAADHGTFDAAPPPAELRQELLGEDPLAWLAPETRSSLVVFTRKRLEFTASDLEARIGKEFGITFTGKKDATEFVVVDDLVTIVKVGDTLVMLTRRPAIASLREKADEYDDLRLRKLIGEHEALLHIATHGAATDAAEAERRRVLARIAAALWHDDFLVFSWHCNEALLPAGIDLQKQLRAEDPVAAMLGTPVLPVLEATDEVAMEQAMAQARREWATAVAHHQKGGELSVKLPFPTRKNGTEHIWVAVTRIDGDTVHGTLANEPADIDGKKLGDAVSGKVAQLSDWLFVRDGTMVGGFTVKVLQAQQAKKQPKK